MQRKFIIIILLLICPILSAIKTFASNWEQIESNTSDSLYGIWGTSATDVFTVGNNGTIIHFDGTTWSPMDSNTAEDLRGIWGTSDTDIFAVGYNGCILHYDGDSWTSMLRDSSIAHINLYSIWGTSSTVFAVGEEGAFIYYDGGVWSKMYDRTDAPLHDIWGISSADVLAVGQNGVIVRYSGGSSYDVLESVTESYLKGIWGNADNDIFTAGYDGTILHFDGTIWQEMPVGTADDFYDICGGMGKYVFAVGESGMIFIYNGSMWSKMDSGTTRNLRRIWISKENDVFVAGAYGTILHYKNAPPVASFTINNDSGYTTTVFSVDASSSFDQEDSADDLQVRWDWEGDGAWDTDYSALKTATHQYSTEGTYTIVLEVKDTAGDCDTATAQVNVSVNTPPVAFFTIKPPKGNTQTVFTVDASGSSDLEDSSDDLQVRWDWENDGVWDTDYSALKTATHQYETNSTYTIRMQIMDTGGLTDTATQQIKVIKSFCIATELLGKNDPRLKTLRKFRDEVLQNSRMGRELIRLYYSMGEKIGKAIEKNPAMKKNTRAILEAVLPTIEKIVNGIEK